MVLICNITTHLGFCNQALQLCPSKEGHMQLITHELLSSCYFTHLIIKDIQSQGPLILLIKVLKKIGLILKFHVINDFGMMCKMHGISIQSFYFTKCHKRCLDGWMTFVKNLYTHYESLHMTKSQPSLAHVALTYPKVNLV